MPTWREEVEKEFGVDVYHSGFCGDVISSGSFIVDFLTGIGGFPLGHIVEIFGEEGSGKTTLVLETIKGVLDKKRPVLFLDYECTVSDGYLNHLGIDPIVLKDYRVTPDSMEDGFMLMKRFCERHRGGLIVTDSIAAMPPISDVKKMAEIIGQVKVASMAHVMAVALRQMTNVFHKSNNCAIFVNQERSKIDVLRGLPGKKTTPGGLAVKFFAAMRVKIRLRKPYIIISEDSLSGLKDEKSVDGIEVWVEVIKNKFSRSYTKGSIVIRMNAGIDNIISAIAIGERIGLVTKKSGGNYFLCEDYSGDTLGQKRVRGLERLNKYFQDNPKIWQKFYGDVAGFLRERMKS